MIIQCDSADTDKVSVAFHGATWAFRAAFDLFGVQAVRNEDQYLRVMPNVDAANDGNSIKHVLGEGVLRNTVVRVTVEGTVPKGTAVDTFLKELQDIPSLFF